MGKMFYQYCVFVLFGYLSFSHVSGVEILETGPFKFLKNGLLTLTCEQATNTDESQNLMFEFNGNTTIDALKQRSYNSVDRKSRLVLQKNVTVQDTGTYICKFKTDQASVKVDVYEETREYDHKRFRKASTDLTEGDDLVLECPVMEQLEATVTWTRDEGQIRDGTEQDIGNKIYKGRLTVKDVTVDDRGHYTCTAKWYSGEIQLRHLVRVKSKLAPLWPAIGIILEILVLVVIILVCKDKRKKDEEPLNVPATSGNAENEKGSRRKYATTST